MTQFHQAWSNFDKAVGWHSLALPLSCPLKASLYLTCRQGSPIPTSPCSLLRVRRGRRMIIIATSLCFPSREVLYQTVPTGTLVLLTPAEPREPNVRRQYVA